MNDPTSLPIDVHPCIACCVDFSEGAGFSPRVTDYANKLQKEYYK